MPDNPLALRRMWKLRQFPMFAETPLGDLALLAENVVEVAYRGGELIAPGGRPVAVELVVSGGITAGRDTWLAGDAFGLLQVLGKQALTAPAIATQPTRTLQLAAEDAGDVLEEGVGIMRAVLHELAGRAQWQPVYKPRPLDVRAHPLSLVERLHVLRRVPAFETSRIDSVAALAHVAHEMVTPGGVTLALAGDRALRAHVVLEGSLRVSCGDESHVVASGGVVGGLEVIGGLSHRFTTTTVTPMRTLALDADAVLDVFEEHPDLALAVGSRIAANLLSDARAADRPRTRAGSAWSS